MFCAIGFGLGRCCGGGGLQYLYPRCQILIPCFFPSLQPYRQRRAFAVVTLLQNIMLTNDSDLLPLHRQRQVSAFPPNYVHSLDSSHMILTVSGRMSPLSHQCMKSNLILLFVTGRGDAEARSSLLSSPRFILDSSMRY